MQTAFYLYTILVIFVCVSAGTLSLAAYLICRRRMYLYAMAFFCFYFLDLALIFQYEYGFAHHDETTLSYYMIDSPLIKTILAVGALESLWLMTCDQLRNTNRALIVVPPIVFLVLSAAVVALFPEGALKQWTYYGLRQVFLGMIAGWWLVHYARLPEGTDKMRLRRYLPLMVTVAVFAVVIFAEDSVVILLPSAISMEQTPIAMLYLSERNFSENILCVLFAIFIIRAAGSLLRLRFNEPPSGDTDPRRQYIEDALPAYANSHHLTAREREVLALLLDGKDNQNIASELYLAVGTVKAHTHNILKKAGCANRQELVQDFWKDAS